MPTEEEIAAQKVLDDAAAAKAKADEDEAKALGLGDAGKKALDAERLRAKNAELASTEANKELVKLRKQQSDAEAAIAKATEEEAARKGEFEKLATDRAAERDTLKSQLEAATAELQTIWDDRTKRMDTEIKAFPKDLPDWKYYPGDGATKEQRWTWFEKAATSEAEKVTDAQGKPRILRTPNANGITPDTALEAERQRALATGKYAL